MTLSVIVPVYNVEKYLQRCVDSILNQTFSDYEIILINDGSTGNCVDLCGVYRRALIAKEYESIYNDFSFN